jgi:hypothetical protein
VPVAAPFATLADVEALHGPVDTSAQPRVAVLLGMASDVILAYRPSITALASLPVGVRVVCAQLVVAVLTAGAAKREQIGEYSVEAASTLADAMELTAGQIAALDRALGVTGSTPRGKRLGTMRIRQSDEPDPVIS